MEEKPAGAKASGIGHGSQEFGNKTSSRMVRIKCGLKVI
jgi:hypothetical protein